MAQAGSQSLHRGLLLIDLLSKYPNGCPLAKLSQESKLNKSTTYRLIQELQLSGFVSPAQLAGSYKLTTKLLELGYIVMSSSSIYNIISPELEALNIELGETINFSTRTDDHAILLYKLNPTQSIQRTRSSLGHIVHFYCTGMGKIFLAFETDHYIKTYWDNHRSSIIPLTDTTIVNFDDMLKEIEEIRKNFYAFDNEENEPGFACIAVPIFDINYNIDYALSSSMTTKKLQLVGKERVIKLLLETAKRISSQLGCADYYNFPFKKLTGSTNKKTGDC